MVVEVIFHAKVKSEFEFYHLNLYIFAFLCLAGVGSCRIFRMELIFEFESESCFMNMGSVSFWWRMNRRDKNTHFDCKVFSFTFSGQEKWGKSS